MDGKMAIDILQIIQVKNIPQICLGFLQNVIELK